MSLPSELAPYLLPSTWIDADHPAVRAQAQALAEGAGSAQTVAERCFTFVRDQIQHCLDFARPELTCRASDVLALGTGYCYAKSHLLAGLLRANGIPAGLCYQRLSFGDAGGGPYCLHGLVAVHLPEHGWYRIDARGNKPGVDAAFCPPREQLAFAIRDPLEADLPEIWAEPLAVIVQALTQDTTAQQVAQALPDVQLARFGLGLRAAV
jgi:transglutaminase-like putative cysteine protease